MSLIILNVIRSFLSLRKSMIITVIMCNVEWDKRSLHDKPIRLISILLEHIPQVVWTRTDNNVEKSVFSPAPPPPPPGEGRRCLLAVEAIWSTNFPRDAPRRAPTIRKRDCYDKKKGISTRSTQRCPRFRNLSFRSQERERSVNALSTASVVLRYSRRGSATITAPRRTRW